MTSQNIKNIILNYKMTEELLWEYLELDFKITIVGVFNAIYVLLTNYDKNKELIDELLFSLELLAKKEKNIDNVKGFHTEIKILIGSIFRNLKPATDENLKIVIRRLQGISRYLKQILVTEEAAKKIVVMEVLINENRNLKIISNLIRDNKDILKIKDGKNENILYKLLKKYSYIDEANVDEINYLYQVISLFINSDDLNVDIVKNTDYYISALKNRVSKHVKQVKKLLEFKKQPIWLGELENKYGLHTSYSKVIEQELNSFKMMHNGAIDFTNQQCYTIDGEGTECLDDALYFERNKDGSYTLYVHITYIPSLIPSLSKINKESIRRVETYYLVDGAYTLYPDYISNYLASLLPNNIRYTETGIWLVEPDMTIVEDSFRLVKSTIKSHHRLTYEGADEIIGSRSKDCLCRSLTDLGRLSLKQRKKNSKKEKYRERENAHSTNPIHESRLVDNSVSANIVQECALLFGRSKAEYYKERGLPYIFRACGEQQRLDLDGVLLSNLTEENQRQISTMAAYYTAIPEIHHGLGYEAYCHAGSPARRSPDGQNQYIDEDLIFTPNFVDKTVYMWEDRTRYLVEYYNETVQRIDAFSSQYNYLMGKRLIRKK